MIKKVCFSFVLMLWCMAAMAQQVSAGAQVRAGRNSVRMENMEFYSTDEARRIGDQMLLWQRNTGGWPKNIDMAAPMSDSLKAKVLADKVRRDDSTTDNGATTKQMKFLARLYKATQDVRYRDAFRRGVEYLLSGQYANGGWPQFWPVQRDYQIHITYNDDAMVNTMEMIRDIYDGVEPFGGDLCDPSLRKSLRKSFDKGVDCILATQMVLTADGIVPAAKWNKAKQKGTLTVWCQQHDRETLMPAPARAYELPSYSSQESASIVRLLMQIPNPDKRVKAAVHAAMAWFDKYKLTGLRVVRTLENGVRDTRLISDTNAETPIWGRYYDLENCVPYVCDRDGIPRRRLEDIGSERRNGYSWYGSRAAELYDIYNAWADKYDKANKVAISLDTKGANENGTLRLGVVPKVNEALFDALKPAPLGRYHHDSQFYVVNCRLSKNILDEDIAHAYKAQPELAKGKTIDPCPWGHRVYYINNTREGGHSGWLSNNVGTGEEAPTYFSTNAQWTFAGKWDQEKRIRDLWSVLAY